MRRARSSASWKSAAPGKLGGDDGVEVVRARDAAEEAGRQHRIEHAPPLAQDARQARRGAHDGGDQLDETGVALEQGEQLNPGGQLGQEAVEADEGEVRVRRGCQRLDQQGLHLGQQLADTRRAHGRIAPMVPGAHPGDHRGGPREAHLGERFERAGVVLLSGEDHVGAPTRQLRALLEEANVVRLHALQLGGEAGRERRRIGKSAEAGERGELVGVFRQPLRLLVAEHLQPVLDVAQEAVGRIEVVSHIGADPARRR